VRCGRGRGQGGSTGFEFARVGEREGKGGAYGYEACEVKKKGKNYAVFYFAGKIFFFFNIYEVCAWKLFYKRATFHYLRLY
jgi:hypothetical protein